MESKELETNLQHLSKTDLRIILWIVRLRWLRYKVSNLRPRHLLIPATLAQIIAFIFAAYTEHFFHYVGTSNMIIIAIALIPMTLSRPQKAHWVKAYK